MEGTCRRGGEGAGGTGRRGEGGGRRGKSPALSVFIMMPPCCVSCITGDRHSISRRRRRRSRRRRVHLKMRLGPLPPQPPRPPQNAPRYYNANKMFCLGDTSLMCSHSSFFQGQKHQ